MNRLASIWPVVISRIRVGVEEVSTRPVVIVMSLLHCSSRCSANFLVQSAVDDQHVSPADDPGQLAPFLDHGRRLTRAWYMRRAALVTGSSGVTTMGKATMSLNVAPPLTATTRVVITSRTLALISTRPSPA